MGKLKSYVMEQLELGYGVHPETLEPYLLEEEEEDEQEEDEGEEDES